MNFFNRLKFATRMVFSNSVWSEFVRAFVTGEDHPLIPGENYIMGYSVAMKYSAVFACVRVLAETLASTPIMLYRKKSDDGRETRNDLAIYDILHNRPNEEMSPFNFKEACMVSLNTGGNAVCERLVNGYGDLVGLYPYRWQLVDPKRDPETNKLIYRVRSDTDSQLQSNVYQKTLRRDQVFHVPGLSYNGIIGMSPIEYTASAIRLGLSYEQFGVNFYKNGMNPSIALEYPGELGEVAYERLKKDLTKNYAGLSNTGKPFLAEGGAKVKELTIKPADAQLIENKRFQIEDIARIYRVPLHLIQELSRSTNNNIEKQSLEFVMYTMLPWFKRWEENINMQLLSPLERRSGFYVEFKIDSLLRGDIKSRCAAYALGRQWGWLSVNDIRRLENMNPIPNGDIYLEPLNMGEAGKADEMTNKLAESIYNMITRGRDAA